MTVRLLQGRQLRPMATPARPRRPRQSDQEESTIFIAWTAYVSGWPVLWAAAGLYAAAAVVAWRDRGQA